MCWTYYTAGLALFLCALASTPAQAQIEPTPVEYTVFFKASPVGTEQVIVTKTGTGITISGSSRIGAPINLVVRKVEIKYDAGWRPQEFTLDATVRDQWTAVYTRITEGSAVSDIRQIGQQTAKTDKVSPDTVLIPNAFFGSYEAVAARLKSASPGAELRAYVVPQGEIAIRLNRVIDEQLRVGPALLPAKRYQVTLVNPGVPLDAEVWADASGSLLRFSVPVQALDVVRNDIATVSARRESVTRPNDEMVMIPATGFNLAATFARPPGSEAPAAGSRARVPRLPAAVLVGGSDPTDRDEMVAGIPIFAQLASAIADAGFLVVRYDKRGIGQSGGRAESATLNDYAEDVRAVVRYLQKRKDVDQKRIAVVGHAEGGWIGLAASAGEKRIAALVLVSTASVTGAELMLEEQQLVLERLGMPEAQRLAKIELQRKIQQAAITGKGWEAVPPELRRQADTPWFQSYLLFDPARKMRDVRQPLLVIHGDLDRQIVPSHADRLGTLAEARKRRPGQTVQVVHVPGVNHLLVPATTGEPDEYGKLTDRNVSRPLVGEIGAWLQKALPAAAR